MREFSRQTLVSRFFSPQVPKLSVPLLTFIDGFGLYRNMYRCLMGMYLMIAAFSSRERYRRTNVFPLTLGPHGSNFPDVIEALGGMMQQLDRGLTLSINGLETFVCVFTMAYTGDMPQQQENSGFLSQNATFGCQFYEVSAGERSNLQFDILGQGCFHHEVLRQREHMYSINGKTAREAYGRSIGGIVQYSHLQLHF